MDKDKTIQALNKPEKPKNEYDNIVPTYIQAVSFGILSTRQIRRNSVVQVVTEHSFYQKESKFIDEPPEIGGLFDTRMGVLGRRERCRTCRYNNYECIGHFGHIELEVDVLNAMFIDKIKAILQCVCWNCSLVKLHPCSKLWKEITYKSNPDSRFSRLLKHCQDVKVCRYIEGDDIRGCGSPQPSFHVDSKNHVFILACWEDDKPNEPSLNTSSTTPINLFKQKVRLSPAEIYIVLRRIDEEHYWVLGLDPLRSRPESLVLENLPVIPPNIRPPHLSSSGEDPLTHKYADISRANNKIIKFREQLEHLTDGQDVNLPKNYNQDDLWRLMQYHVGALMCCKKLPNQLARKLMKRLMDLTYRLIKKKGRVRENLLGKRVDHTHRAVIIPDPDLNIDQVAISADAAKILDFPVTVTSFNIDDLRQRVLRGPNIYNGANAILLRPGDKEKIDLTVASESERRIIAENLKIGMVVERHMKDGDKLIIFRQPSLHRYSLLVFSVLVKPGSYTIDLNQTAPEPFNADFDGDEMNGHQLMTPQTVTEGSEIMAFEKNCLVPQSSGPVYGLLQDELLGAHLMTVKDAFFTRNQAMRLLEVLIDREDYFPVQHTEFDKFHFVLPDPCILKPQRLWTGKQLFSLLLPPDFNEWKPTLMHRKDISIANPMCDTILIIRDGEMLSGHLDHKSMGSSINGLLHKIANDYENGIFARFLNRSHHICGTFISKIRPVTLGLKDVQPPPGFQKRIDTAVSLVNKKIDEWVSKGMNDNDLERRVHTCIGSLTNEAYGDTMSAMKPDNNFKSILDGGTKGSSTNASQIIRVVGQQNIKGGRLRKSLFGFENRALPWSKPNDKSLQGCGYISKPYISGIPLHDFVIACICGRIGMIDTSVRTSLSGYAFRRMCGAMSDVFIRADNTVRNSNQDIVQFAFGDDGFDPSFCEYQSIYYQQVLHKGIQSIEDVYKWTDEELLNNQLSVNNQFIIREWSRIQKDIQLCDKLHSNGSDLWVPCHFDRFIHRALTWQRQYKNKDNSPYVNPVNVVKDVYMLQLALFEYLPKQTEKWDNLYFILLRSYLSSKRVCTEYKFKRTEWNQLLEAIKTKFRKSICSIGESVGTVSAQSASQKFTQLSLSGFHQQGSAKSNMTNIGISRYSELINASSSIKEPSMNLILNSPYNRNQKVVYECMRSVQFLKLKNIIKGSIKITECNDPIPNGLVYKCTDSSSTLCNWIAELQLDVTMFTKYNITVSTIVRRIWNMYNKSIYIWYSPEYSQEGPKIFIRIVSKVDHDISKLLIKDFTTHLLEKIIIQGIEGVTESFISPLGKNDYSILTRGSNLKSAFQFDFISTNLSTSNDAMRIFEHYGIEAYRSTLVRELNSVLGSVGAPINGKHLLLMADVMTHQGTITSMTRHGINRVSSTSVLEKGSFEELTEQLTNGALFNRLDPVRSTNETLILGKASKNGTGSIDCLLDTDVIMNSSNEQSDIMTTSMETTYTKTIDIDEDMEFDHQPIDNQLLGMCKSILSDYSFDIRSSPQFNYTNDYSLPILDYSKNDNVVIDI